MVQYEVCGLDVFNGDDTVTSFVFETRDEYDFGLSAFINRSIDLNIAKFRVFDNSHGGCIFEVFCSTPPVAVDALMSCLNEVTANMVKNYTYNEF